MFKLHKWIIIWFVIFWLGGCTLEKTQNNFTKVDEVVFTDEENKINATVITHSNYELQIHGEASGTWFFEAEFWLELLDENNNLLSEWFVTAQWEWMTVDYVPFMWKIAYLSPETEYGYLIFKKANPSWLEQYDFKKSVKVKIK